MSNEQEPNRPGEGEIPYSQKEGETVSIGVGGYKLSNGYVLDDYLPQLQGDRARKKYREMGDYPTLAAIITAIDMILRAVDFRFEKADGDLDERYLEFAKRQFEDIETPWDDVLSEALTFLQFGFSLMEMVFKRLDDGLITTAKLAPRAQESVIEWDVDNHGDVRGVWQWPPFGSVGGSRVYIPASHLLHFKTKMDRGNPEGRSIFRGAYNSYHYAKNITTIEAIATERELNGLPVIKIPAAAFSNATVKAAYEKMARDVIINEQGGVLIPSDPYKDSDGKLTSVPQYQMELLSSNGSRNIDTSTIIIRHQQDMVRTVLADFLMLGATDKGSFALSKSKTDLFLRSVESYLNVITEELNNKWMKTLWDLNGFDHDLRPTLKTGKVSPVDLAELGSFVRDTGLMAMLDNNTENYLREVAGLPKADDSEAI